MRNHRDHYRCFLLWKPATTARWIATAWHRLSYWSVHPGYRPQVCAVCSLLVVVVPEFFWSYEFLRGEKVERWGEYQRWHDCEKIGRCWPPSCFHLVRNSISTKPNSCAIAWAFNHTHTHTRFTSCFCTIVNSVVDKLFLAVTTAGSISRKLLLLANQRADCSVRSNIVSYPLLNFHYMTIFCLQREKIFHFAEYKQIRQIFWRCHLISLTSSHSGIGSAQKRLYCNRECSVDNSGTKRGLKSIYGWCFMVKTS